MDKTQIVKNLETLRADFQAAGDLWRAKEEAVHKILSERKPQPRLKRFFKDAVAAWGIGKSEYELSLEMARNASNSAEFSSYQLQVTLAAAYFEENPATTQKILRNLKEALSKVDLAETKRRSSNPSEYQNYTRRVEHVLQMM